MMHALIPETVNRPLYSGKLVHTGSRLDKENSLVVLSVYVLEIKCRVRVTLVPQDTRKDISSVTLGNVKPIRGKIISHIFYFRQLYPNVGLFNK